MQQMNNVNVSNGLAGNPVRADGGTGDPVLDGPVPDRDTVPSESFEEMVEQTGRDLTRSTSSTGRDFEADDQPDGDVVDQERSDVDNPSDEGVDTTRTEPALSPVAPQTLDQGRTQSQPGVPSADQDEEILHVAQDEPPIAPSQPRPEFHAPPDSNPIGVDPISLAPVTPSAGPGEGRSADVAIPDNSTHVPNRGISTVIPSDAAPTARPTVQTLLETPTRVAQPQSLPTTSGTSAQSPVLPDGDLARLDIAGREMLTRSETGHDATLPANHIAHADRSPLPDSAAPMGRAASTAEVALKPASQIPVTSGRTSNDLLIARDAPTSITGASQQTTDPAQRSPMPALSAQVPSSASNQPQLPGDTRAQRQIVEPSSNSRSFGDREIRRAAAPETHQNTPTVQRASSLSTISPQSVAVAPLVPASMKEVATERVTSDLSPISDVRLISDSALLRATSEIAAQRPELPRHIAMQLTQALQQVSASRAVELALNPAELGRVRIALKTTDTAVLVQITADRPETLDLMRRHVDALAQEFHAIGYQDAQFSFSQQNSDHNQSEPLIADQDTPRQSGEISADPTLIPSTTRALYISDRVDIRV
ncbi:MAG: flagellar hook-length control protein FliK [Roseovarius sp.]